MKNHSQRIIELQKQVRIAREALEKIRHGSGCPERVAEDALERLWPLDRKQPLQGLVGHGGNQL